MPADRDDDEIATWQAHTEPGHTVERTVDAIGRFARNSAEPGDEAQHMARAGKLIIAGALGLLLVVLAIAVVVDLLGS